MIPSWFSFGFWPFCFVMLSLTHMLPAQHLYFTLYMCTHYSHYIITLHHIKLHSHYFSVCLFSWKVIILAAFKSILGQSRCLLEPKKALLLKPTLRDSECPVRPPPAMLTGATPVFLLIMFTPFCLNRIVGFKLKILSKTIQIFKADHNFKQEIHFQ